MWLLLEKDFIVDIAGDQFKDDSDYIIYNKVEDVGREENLHKRFNENRNIETKTDLEDMFNARSKTLKAVYDTIKNIFIICFADLKWEFWLNREKGMS